MNEKISIQKKDLQDLYNDLMNSSGISKEQFASAMKKAFGEDAFKPQPVTERIKTFEDACRELGEDNPLVSQYEQIEAAFRGDKYAADFVAYLKLRIITAALNEGWEPQFVKGERRWYFWYDLITKEQYDKLSDEDKRRCVLRSGSSSNANSGLVCAYASHASSYSNTGDGARLAFKNEKLAAYAGRQFAEIYADFCFKSDAKAGSAEM